MYNLKVVYCIRLFNWVAFIASNGNRIFQGQGSGEVQ